MYELLNIEVKDGKQLVSARELHEYLGVRRDFTTWIKGRIAEYDFRENVDFTVIWNDTKTGDVVEYNGNSNSMVKLGYQCDYAITIEMAKELCMVEKNDKGKMARRYFIKMENLTKQLSTYYDEKLAIITDRLDRTEKMIGIRCKQKFDYGRYIKNKMGINKATKEYENAKMVLFAELGVKMWEEIDYSLDVIAKIDEILEVLKLDNQLSLVR